MEYMSINFNLTSVEVRFRLVLSEEQYNACNSYLLSDNDCDRLLGPITDFNDIIEFVSALNRCLYCLGDSGWNTDNINNYKAPNRLTLDLSGIRKFKT